MSPMYLGGPSVNPHWNVPRALHSLEGEIEAARKVIEVWEPFCNIAWPETRNTPMN